jgi:hypothetical protein
VCVSVAVVDGGGGGEWWWWRVVMVVVVVVVMMAMESVSDGGWVAVKRSNAEHDREKNRYKRECYYFAFQSLR